MARKLIKLEKYPGYTGRDKVGTKWQGIVHKGKVHEITVGKGSNMYNPYPKTEKFWWAFAWGRNKDRPMAYKEFKSEKKAKSFALQYAKSWM
jgi:hypothetical protein